MSRVELIDVAMGEAAADLVLCGGQLVNVASGEVYAADVAIKSGRIAAVGDVDHTVREGTKTVDLAGDYILPGLVEAHLHSYHSYIGVPEFTETLLTHGVTAFADGFYGQGIVGGKDAVAFFKNAFEQMPIRLLFLVPTLAYLQNRDSGLTPAPGVSPEDMYEMLEWPGCLGLEEPPSVPIVEKWPEIIELCDRTLAQRKVITGHAAAIDERRLHAYAAIGTTTDHEAVSAEEGVARIRAGMKVFMRMASSALNQLDVVKGVTEAGLDPRGYGFCADEASPVKLVEIGSTIYNLRNAVAQGVPPITAVQMATINNAEAFFVQHDIGIVAPGRRADILVVEDLRDFEIRKVYFGGEQYVENGELVKALPTIDYPDSLRDTVKVSQVLTADSFKVKAPVESGRAEVRVIGVRDADYVCDERHFQMEVKDGFVQPDLDRDILPLAMVDRFGKGTGVGCGFAQGFELKTGAFAQTVNAVCENVVVVGANTEDMAFACQKLIEIGGGFIVVEDEEIKALVELPLLGLMNDEPLSVVMPKFARAYEAVRELGCPLRSPFVSLEFSFACPGIPDLKLSDEGLVRILTAEKVDTVISAA